MFDNVKIVRKKSYVAVYDGEECVNFGERDVDHIFATNVESKMVEMGYEPESFKGETTFKKV